MPAADAWRDASSAPADAISFPSVLRVNGTRDLSGGFDDETVTNYVMGAPDAFRINFYEF
jgi:hypothetical protein